MATCLGARIGQSLPNAVLDFCRDFVWRRRGQRDWNGPALFRSLL